MNWPFKVPHKLRIGVALAGIMVIVVISNVLVRRNINTIDQSFTSIYKDRLMPAADLFYVMEHLYKKRMLLEKYLWSGGSKDELMTKLATHNHSVDSLITEFKKTYLVLNEASLLDEFNDRRNNYKKIENEVLELHHSAEPSLGMSLFENEGIVVFSSMVEDLHELTAIQSKVGKQLLAESHHSVANANVLSFLEVGVAVVLGLVVHIILLTTKAMNRTTGRQKFYLN